MFDEFLRLSNHCKQVCVGHNEVQRAQTTRDALNCSGQANAKGEADCYGYLLVWWGGTTVIIIETKWVMLSQKVALMCYILTSFLFCLKQGGAVDCLQCRFWEPLKFQNHLLPNKNS